MERVARCHCGALQAAVRGKPEWVNVCHCKACRRRTGSVLHALLSLAPPIERFAEGRIGKPSGAASALYPGA